MERNYKVITFLKNGPILRKPRVTNFADIIKIANLYIIKTFKESKKVKRVRNYGLKFSL